MRDTDSQAPAQTAGHTSPANRPAEETARLGDEIYERGHPTAGGGRPCWKVVAIDVESGSWTMGEDEIAATDRLRAQQPDAYDVWCLRVGYRALYSFGGSSLRSAR